VKIEHVYILGEKRDSQSINQAGLLREPWHTHTINLTNKNKREKVTHEHL